MGRHEEPRRPQRGDRCSLFSICRRVVGVRFAKVQREPLLSRVILAAFGLNEERTLFFSPEGRHKTCRGRQAPVAVSAISFSARSEGAQAHLPTTTTTREGREERAAPPDNTLLPGGSRGTSGEGPAAAPHLPPSHLRPGRPSPGLRARPSRKREGVIQVLRDTGGSRDRQGCVGLRPKASCLRPKAASTEQVQTPQNAK